MARQFTFRLTSEGVEQLKRDLEALGDRGKKVFDNLAAAAPRLSDPLTKAGAAADNARAQFDGLGKQTQAAGGAFQKFGPQIQNVGFQLGDIAVQIASGGGILRPLIQQGSQIAQIFGPAGAILGALGAAAGALATSFLDFGSAADKAAKQQDALNEKLERAAELMEKINGKKGERTFASLDAERRNQISLAEAALKDAEAQLARTPQRIGGKGGSTITSAFLEQEAEVKRLQQELTLLRATYGEFGDGLQQLGEKGGEAYKDLSAAQDKVLKNLDAELAQVKATARERFILQAIARDTAKLEGATADQVAAATAQVREKAGAIYDATEAQKRNAEAQQDAARESERQQKATTDATAALDAQFAALADEREQLKLTERERFVHNELLKAEGQIRKGLIKDADAYRARIKAEAGLLFDDTAAKDASDKAAEDRKRDADRLLKEREKEIEREADKQAKLLQAPFLNAAEGIQDVFADTFEKLFKREIVSFEDFAESVTDIFARMAAEVATLLVFRPIVGGFLSGAGLGNVAGQMGFGGGTTGGGMSGGGLGGLFQPGSWNTGLGTMFAGTPSNVGTTTSFGGSGLFGQGANVPTAQGGFGGFMNSPVGGGIAMGVMSGLSALASGAPKGQAIGQAAGAMVGGIIGSYFGPIGAMAGSMLGSMAGGLIGGMFGKKKKNKPKEAEAFLAGNAFGMPVLTEEHESGKLNNMGNELGANAQKAIEDVLLAAGATMPDDVRSRISYFKSDKNEFYKASLYADKGSGLKLGEVGRYASLEDAIAVLAASTLFTTAMQGNVSGTGASTQEAFKYLFEKGGRHPAAMATFDVDKVNEIIDFTKWIDGFDEIRTVSDASRKAIDDFNNELRKLSSQAEEVGIDVAKVTDALKRDFNETVSDELLELTDPQQFALQELEKEYAGRKAVAEKLGVDLVELEELYALKRQQILDQGLEGLADTWKDFINALQFGGASALSPADQLENARKQYESSKSVGGQTFRDAASTYLALQKDAFGSTQAYADLFAEVIALSKKFGDLGDVPGFAAGGDHAGGWRLVGEFGPELEATGASRIFNKDQTAEILRGLVTATQAAVPDHLTSPRGMLRQLGAAGASPAAGEGMKLVAGQLAQFSSSFNRLAAAQEDNNREQRRTRELMRG
jgi:hypothetical protein